MAFYKKQFNKAHNVYYPHAVVVGKPIETKELAKELATVSTVSRADVNAVLGDLAQVLHNYMKNGKSVHLEGLGYFRYKLSAKGVSSLDEFSFSEQVKSVGVQFTPERTKSSSGNYTSELIDYSTIEWIELSSDVSDVTDEDESEDTDSDEESTDEGSDEETTAGEE